jgi:hypothetical protein
VEDGSGGWSGSSSRISSSRASKSRRRSWRDSGEGLWEGEEVVSTCSGTGEDGARIRYSGDGSSSSIE